MNGQFIISIDREYGSGGHIMAYSLADKYNIPIYDSNIIEYLSEEKGLNLDDLKKYDEKAKNRLFTRTVDGYSNSPEDIIASMQFDFLREKADNGMSFVVLGRCASSILKDNPNLISIFVTGDMPNKIKRIAGILNISEDKAESVVIKNNKKRKSYHNLYCKEKWGDSRHYELILNTSRIGIENAIQVADEYIQKRINK